MQSQRLRLYMITARAQSANSAFFPSRRCKRSPNLPSSPFSTLSFRGVCVRAREEGREKTPNLASKLRIPAHYRKTQAQDEKRAGEAGNRRPKFETFPAGAAALRLQIGPITASRAPDKPAEGLFHWPFPPWREFRMHGP